MSEVDRSRLLIRRQSFDGVVNRTLDGSQPDWNLIGHPTPPEGASNVPLVLVDDAGFGYKLARAHARSGDSIAIAAYLGGGASMARAMTKFAVACADQNEADFRQFVGGACH